MESNNNDEKGNEQLIQEDSYSCEKKMLDTKISSKDDSDKDKIKICRNYFPIKNSFSNIFLTVCIVGISLGIFLEIMNASKRIYHRENCMERPKYLAYANGINADNINGTLKHVHSVLKRIGFEKGSNESSWVLLWAHDSPFSQLQDTLAKLKPHQRVNHYPSTGYITYKVTFATTDSKYIPKAFQLPKSKDDFLKYAKENKNSLFLEKLNSHRGVRLKNVSEIDVSNKNSFVQEYVQKPFLVDGHKFDIGVYVVITSINPLRAYWYAGDILMRYCPSKYHPFDPKDLNKYVIGDDYLPTWKVPSLAMPYTTLGYGMKDSFDIYVRSKGKDPSPMWEEVKIAIAEILTKKEHHIIASTKQFPSPENFFEMMRFDLIVDENLKVYLIEANMSPNLDSAHFAENALLYEQVLYNLFALTGISRQANMNALSKKSDVTNMISSNKNIAVFGVQCTTICFEDCEALPLCNLCGSCLDNNLKNSLLKAHTEFLHRGDFRRLVPLPMTQQKDIAPEKLVPKGLQGAHKLQHMWYQEKCNSDVTWCT